MTFNKARALQEAERSLVQGKLSQATRQYLEIVANDPSDLVALNTAGDLLVRDNNIAEALRLFRKLAEAYVREGFVLRAIAIYKKIIKLDPSTIEPMLKLAELYAGQGLTREARDLYAQALAACQTQNQKEKAIEVMRRMVAVEPANFGHLLRLAECSQAVGRIHEALQAYVDAAEAALADGNREGASRAFEQAAAINPDDSRLDSLRRRLSPVVEPEPQLEGTTEGSGEAGAEAASASAPSALAPGSADAAETVAEPAPPAAEAPEAVPEAAEPVLPAAGAAEAVVEAAQPTPPAAGPGELQGSTTEIDLSAEWEAVALSQSAPAAVPEFEFKESVAEVALSPSAPAAVPEFEFKESVAEVAPSPSAPAAAPEFDFEESAAEIDFYLEYGLADEGRKALERLEAKFPGHPQVAELRRRVEARVTDTASASPAATPTGNPLEDLARDLQSSWQGLDHPLETSPPAASPPKLDFAASLGALLNQLGAEPGDGRMEEDPQAHYQLGVAFREMGLLDEAIGEFQKVVRAARSGSLPPHYLSSCSLLGVCFRDKLMPDLAAKWYQRALEVPGLDPEATLALQYDLGLAYEQAGRLDAARERFLEVYGQNIDYRDVAEKVRLLAASS